MDLNFVRFTVKKDNNGIRQFASLVAGALADTSGNSITAEQVLDVLDKIERLGEIEHNEMDMLLDQTREENLSGIESNFRFTVRGWQKRNRTQNVHGFKPKWLDATKKLHQQSSSEDKWRYWPHETYGGNARKVNTRAIVMDEAKFTGTIRICTALINKAQDPNFAREFEQSLTEALNTSYTTERVIAKQPTDIMSTNPEFPYLTPTERALNSKHQMSFTNQQFISRKHYAATEDGPRSEHRANEIIHPINSVPLDTQATVARIAKLSKLHPTIYPSAHCILNADPSGISARFAPHILDRMLEESLRFRQLCYERNSKANFASKKAMVFDYLQNGYLDLMRHQHNRLDLQHTTKATTNCEQFTLKVAEIVTEMSNTARMGDMRRCAIVSENYRVLRDEIRAAKQIRTEFLDASCNMFACKPNGDAKHDEMLARLQYSDLEDIDIHIRNLTQRKDKSRKNERIATEHSGVNSQCKSLIEEWKSIPKKGAHSGTKYIHYIRTSAARLLQEREKRDGHWLPKAAAASPYWDI